VANVSTIGSAKDYATLQGWEDVADGEASADQWAECYSGSDLGAVVISGWASTPDANNYPRIYPAAGRFVHRHDGTRDGNNGAYASGTDNVIEINNVNHVHVEGMYIRTTLNTQWHGGIVITGGDGTVIDGNCIYATHNQVNCAGILLWRYFFLYNWSIRISNNLIYTDRTAGSGWLGGIRARMDAYVSNDYTLNLAEYNNTVSMQHGTTHSRMLFYSYHYSHNYAGSTTLNRTSENCIALTDVASGSNGFYDAVYLGATATTTQTTNWTRNNCLSTDGTADDDGGSGHLVDQTQADIVEAVATNLALKDGSNAIGAGKDLSAYITQDALLNPHGVGGWDMGALARMSGSPWNYYAQLAG